MLRVFSRSFGPIFWFDGPLVNSVGPFCMTEFEFFFFFCEVLSNQFWKVVFLGLELLLNCSFSMKLCVRDYIKQTRLMTFKYTQGEDRRIQCHPPPLSLTHVHTHTLLFVREFLQGIFISTSYFSHYHNPCEMWHQLTHFLQDLWSIKHSNRETLVYILFSNQKYMDRDIRILFKKTGIALRCCKNCLWKTIKFCIYFRVLQIWTLKLCKTLVFVPRAGGV